MAHVTGFYDLPYELKIKIIRCVWSVKTYITLYRMTEFKELVKDSVIRLSGYDNTKCEVDQVYTELMPEVASFQFDELMIEGQDSGAFTLSEILQPANREKFFIVSLQADNTAEFMRCMHIPIMLSTVYYVHHTVILNTEDRHEIALDYFNNMQTDFALCKEFSHGTEIPCAKRLEVYGFTPDASQNTYVPNNESRDHAFELVLPNAKTLFINTTRLNKMFSLMLDFQLLTKLRLDCLPESCEYYLDIINQCISLEKLSIYVTSLTYENNRLPYLEIKNLSLDKLKSLTICSNAHTGLELENCHFESLCQFPMGMKLGRIKNCSFGKVVDYSLAIQPDTTINNLSLPSLKSFKMFDNQEKGTRDLSNIFVSSKLSYFCTNKTEYISALNNCDDPSQDPLSSLKSISVDVTFNPRTWNLRKSFVKMVHLVKNSRINIRMMMRCSKYESRRQEELCMVEITPEAQLLGDRLRIFSDLEEMIVLEFRSI